MIPKKIKTAKKSKSFENRKKNDEIKVVSNLYSLLNHKMKIKNTKKLKRKDNLSNQTNEKFDE